MIGGVRGCGRVVWWCRLLCVVVLLLCVGMCVVFVVDVSVVAVGVVGVVVLGVVAVFVVLVLVVVVVGVVLVVVGCVLVVVDGVVVVVSRVYPTTPAAGSLLLHHELSLCAFAMLALFCLGARHLKQIRHHNYLCHTCHMCAHL